MVPNSASTVLCIHSTGSFNFNDFIVANLIFLLPAKRFATSKWERKTNCWLCACAYYLSQIKWACKILPRLINILASIHKKSAEKNVNAISPYWPQLAECLTNLHREFKWQTDAWFGIAKNEIFYIFFSLFFFNICIFVFSLFVYANRRHALLRTTRKRHSNLAWKRRKMTWIRKC